MQIPYMTICHLHSTTILRIEIEKVIIMTIYTNRYLIIQIKRRLSSLIVLKGLALSVSEMCC